MKKFFGVLLIITFVAQSFCVPEVVHGKTLGQLEQELKNKQNELQETENKKALTQAQINSTKNDITNIQNSINQTYVDISNLDKEIEQLNKDIIDKNKEIKEIINYTQVSNGESMYLEYAFGAQDFTDFIYRMAIAEQMSNYNESLIKEYNQSIEDSKKKQEEIANKRIELESKHKTLQEKMDSLGTELTSVSDISISIADEVAYQKELLQYYRDKGCNTDDDIATCGRTQLPPGTALFRPIVSGYVTSFFGPRSYDGYHKGIDTSTSITAPPVYAAGNGVVSAIWHRYSCGGNMVFIQHNINGVKYTTLYAHLLSYNVSVGDTVTRNTVIGYMGGGRNTTTAGGGWDSPRCTTGQHLHFQLATGLYDPIPGRGDYSSYAAFTAHTIDPQKMVNFPNSEYVAFSDRTTAY